MHSKCTLMPAHVALPVSETRPALLWGDVKDPQLYPPMSIYQPLLCSVTVKLPSTFCYNHYANYANAKEIRIIHNTPFALVYLMLSQVFPLSILDNFHFVGSL